MHCAHALRVLRRVGRRAGTNEQRLPKAAQPEKVEILLAGERIERRQMSLRFVGKSFDAHRLHVRFGEVAQTMARSMLDESMEEDRFVRHGKIVVADLAVAVLSDRTEFRTQGLVGFVSRRAAVSDEAGDLSRGVESGARVVDAIDVVVEHVPRGLAHATARQHVEAHVQDAVTGEAFGSEGKQRVADIRRHPRIHAMRDDEVELAVRGRKRRQVPLHERDVRKSESADRTPSGVERVRRKVAANETRGRQRHRHRDEVGAIVAPDFEDAAARNTWSDMSAERRDRRKPGGMGCLMRQRVVRDLLVATRECGVRGVDADRRS